MGYDLYNTNGEHYRFNISSWSALLRLAERYGWQAAGTTLYKYECDDDEENCVRTDVVDHEWNGTYFSNDGQVVGSEDASNLANALEKALPDIPDVEAYPSQFVLCGGNVENYMAQERQRSLGKLVVTYTEWKSGTLTSVPDIVVCADIDEFSARNDDLYGVFSGKPYKDYLRGFIQFCRTGEFWIS